MRWYLTNPEREFSEWAPLQMGMSVPNVSFPTLQPSAAIHGDGWNLLPLTDDNPQVGPNQKIAGRAIAATAEEAHAVYTIVNMTQAEIDARDAAVAPIIVYKSDIWRRCTEQEAAVLDEALANAPVKMRRLWDDSQQIETSAPEFALFRAQMVAAFTEARTVEILAPSET